MATWLSVLVPRKCPCTSAARGFASILVGVPTMRVKHSDFSLFSAVCLTVYLLQLRLLCSSLRVEDRCSNLLDGSDPLPVASDQELSPLAAVQRPVIVALEMEQEPSLVTLQDGPRAVAQGV